MDVKIINPFIMATIEVIETMANIRPVRTGLRIKQKNQCCFGDISGVIGFAGDITGSLAVSFPKDIALKIIGSMVGEDMDWESKIFREGVSEIANMVLGNTKGKIAQEMDLLFNLSIPSIICGRNHYVTYPSNMQVIVVEFNVKDIGNFTLELCAKKE